MKRIVIIAVLSMTLALTVAAPLSPAQSRAHRAAMKLCKQKYKDAIRGAKYLRGHDRRAKVRQARIERAECERLAPR